MRFILEVQSIGKHFGGVAALSDVSFAMQDGQRHALLGENGAGKSTLIKILAGQQRADSGSILLDGERYMPTSPAAARQAGVVLVPQELSYCPNLSVSENLMLGELPSRLGFLRRGEMRAEALRRLERLGLTEINPDWPMSRLSTGQAQATQIAGAIARQPKLLLLDEPTSALSRGEATKLAQILAQLKTEGVSVLYVSHRMEEIFGSPDSGFTLCDTSTVLRDGRHVETAPLRGRSSDDVVKLMIGRELKHELLEHLSAERLRETPASTMVWAPPVRLKIENLCDPQRRRFEGISLDLRAGEVLGVAGLVGSGRTELARAIVGLDRGATGDVWLDGKRYDERSVRASLTRGLVYLTEDRKREGLVLGMSGTANWSLPFVSRFSPGAGLLRRGGERREASAAFESLKVKSAHPDSPVLSLSGGNQQKVLFARWLSVQPEPGIIILDEPTRGVDVGSKAEIHRLISELSTRGAAVLVISSDLPELLAVSSKMVVLRRGAIAGWLKRSEMSEHAAAKLMVGGAVAT